MSLKSKSRTKTAFVCTACGTAHSKWQGQCKGCGEWNSLVEERLPTRSASATAGASAAEVQRLGDVATASTAGYQSGIDEFDRVLGGQLVPGMTVLLAGDPGIGKSTLLLQAAAAFAEKALAVLYVSGEESPAQLRLRAERLAVGDRAIDVLGTTDLNEITGAFARKSYNLILVDSIQTVAAAQFDSPPGTVGQVREAAHQLAALAKMSGAALVLVGHVTKDGMVAGPKVLEHLVDTVLTFEGDQSLRYRILRASKNRFGSISEIGLFEMTGQGLLAVDNPSALFLSETESSRTGAAVCCLCEGSRPLLVEVQALVTPANYGNPQRVAGGLDNRKLALILAILEKRGGYPMGTHDVFVSIAGGLRVTEPAFDLPTMVAIVSSLTNRPIDARTVLIGEVTLAGELRPVTQLDLRLAEAGRLGFSRAIISNSTGSVPPGISVHAVGSLAEAIEIALD